MAGKTGEFDCVVSLRIHPGKEAEAEALLHEMEAATLANDEGCLRYEWYRSAEAERYVLLERWTDMDAVHAHLEAPHMAATFAKLQPLVAEPFTSQVVEKL